MEAHALEPYPPEISFQVFSKHGDPLSRQLMEAVSIRDKGNLNRKNEFSVNELVKLLPSKYTWDADKEDNINKKSAVERDSKLKCFVQVMSNVVKCNKVLENEPMLTNVNSYRHLKTYSNLCLKRKMDEDAQGEQKRKRVFDTSTPMHYRQTSWDTDVSTGDDLTQDTLDVDNSAQSDDGRAGQAKTNLSRETEDVIIDTEKPPETPIQTLAAHAVTMDSYRDAQDSYNRRQNIDVLGEESLIKCWNSDEKFKANHSDSKSFEVSELLEDQEEMFLDRLFNQVEDVVTGISDEPKEIDYDTSWLFGNMQDMYFEEDIIDHNKIENMILHKKQNKLFSIFLKQQTLAPTPKRKLSPQEQTINKMRRMTINSDTSPALRTPRRRIQITMVRPIRQILDLSTRSLTRGYLLEQ